MRELAFSIGAVAAFLLAACGGDIEPGRTEGSNKVIRGLELATVEESTVSGSKAFVGSVESPDRGVLSARIDGRVTRIAVNEGDEVKAGELLLTIEDNVARGRLREAEAAVAEARGAEEQAAAKLDLAQKTYRRYQQLFEKEAMTRQEMDRITAELEVARQGVRAAEAAVRRAQSALEVARIGLSHTRVTAPYDAFVVRKEVEEGSTVLPGAPLITLDRKGAWRVRAELPESLSGQIAVGDPLTIEIPALGRDFPGRVAEVLPASDPRSRSFQIKVSLIASAPLKAGLFARVYLAPESDLTLLVPAAAVLNRGQLTVVYVLEDGVLRLRLVKLGRHLGDRVEVLSGLNPGEVIVVGGAERAQSGARVEG